MTTTQDRLMTASEGARMLRLAPRALDRMAQQGEVPSVMLPNGERRYIEADLWRWVESHKTEVPAR